MTNIYPDHLDTYNGMKEYAEAKANIFRYQHETDLAIFNYDNLWTRRLGEEAKAETWYTSLERWGSFARHSTHVFPFLFSETPMIGKHNLENILLATTTAKLLGVPDEIIGNTVRNFHGVAQRLEEIAVVNGVRYINDTTSTTPVAGRVALNAFDAPIVLVAGGNTKFLPLEDWPETIVKKCRDVVLLEGTGTHELLPAIQEVSTKIRDCRILCVVSLTTLRLRWILRYHLAMRAMFYFFHLVLRVLECSSMNLTGATNL